MRISQRLGFPRCEAGDDAEYWLLGHLVGLGKLASTELGSTRYGPRFSRLHAHINHLKRMGAVGSLEFYRFCDILTTGLASSDDEDRPLTLLIPGSPVRVPAAVINYAGYVRDNVVSECPVGKDGKRDVEAVGVP